MCELELITMAGTGGPRKPDPSASPRAIIGAELRHARERKGLSQEALGESLFVSGSYIGQMEAGTRRIPQDIATQLDGLLDTGGFFERNCRAANKSRYPDHFAEAAEAEAVAEAIKEFAPLLIPGLMQTEAYAREVFHAYQPTAPEEKIDELVAARLERGRLLADPTKPLLWVVLGEAVLRQEVGGRDVMAGALSHVAALARRRRLIVQVLPFGAGAYGAMEGSLKLMSFKDAPTLAYLQGLNAGRLEDDPGAVRRHELTYDLLGADALSPRESLALIETLAEDYAHEDRHP
ncbi:helix-turn-helix transcriptional regulator [Streptomyces solicathayae]|uniref:Helix-turn-helix transcriptional regulator n=1 Tax=Streptomyces solicathayae TaxID=3081768 RepID=A0ABZ0LWQ8_9ACTN|nr:helix-turn-helix transcriptional regulator [Streptomyces sp. HUAS YS2]WOX23631.1 helix-turn-helix transcriptional regulator [Streptomyces sp. HUAS YS2]